MRPLGLSASLLLLAACGQPGQTAAATIDNRTEPSAEPAPAAVPTAAASLLATTAPSPLATEAGAAQSVDESNAGVVKVLSDVLVAAGQLDGAAITRVRQVSRCTTAFTTSAGETRIDWTGVGDWLSRNEAGKVVIPIAAGGRTYRFTVPQERRPEPVGDAGATVESAFGSLVDGCGKG